MIVRTNEERYNYNYNNIAIKVIFSGKTEIYVRIKTNVYSNKKYTVSTRICVDMFLFV